jgi:predicted methyltransferase
MTLRSLLSSALLWGGVLGVSLPAEAAPARVDQAVAATAQRSPDNVALDASRKPAELLAFFGLRRGDRVADMFGINGYWAEIMAPAVGPRGRVTVWQPTQFVTDERRATFEAGAGRQANVVLVSSPFEAPDLPSKAFDFMLINLDYHDVYWENVERGIPRMDPEAWLTRLYAAMKPGGIVGVVDHAAKASSEPRASVEKLHRIDPVVVRNDFERAGFVLEGTSDLLANPADDHSRLVFDKEIRGKTDRFIMKFRKPRR